MSAGVSLRGETWANMSTALRASTTPGEPHTAECVGEPIGCSVVVAPGAGPTSLRRSLLERAFDRRNQRGLESKVLRSDAVGEMVAVRQNTSACPPGGPPSPAGPAINFGRHDFDGDGTALLAESLIPPRSSRRVHVGHVVREGQDWPVPTEAPFVEFPKLGVLLLE